MSVNKSRRCWRKDLAGFRGLTNSERSVFLLVLEWFDSFRARCDLETERDATEEFWRTEVVPENRPREFCQLEQWENAIKWYLNWLDACAIENAEYPSLLEWARGAMWSAGTRRGLAPPTKRCYRAWAARYATFAGSKHEMKQLDSATRFLASVLNDEDCAYSTQKQALNAMTLFFIQIWDVENPVFGVKLTKKT